MEQVVIAVNGSWLEIEHEDRAEPCDSRLDAAFLDDTPQPGPHSLAQTKEMIIGAGALEDVDRRETCGDAARVGEGPGEEDVAIRSKAVH